VIFSVILTVVLGGLLAFVAVSLRPEQKRQEDMFKKKSILGSVMTIGKEDDVLKIYKEKIQSFVVDYNGKVVSEIDGEPLLAENVAIKKEYKKAPEDRLYPVFEILNGNGEAEAFIFPIYGNGLWDKINGFVALENDCNTIKGIVFDHIGETPGLGARITEKGFQERFIGKTIFDGNGRLVGITILKGESNNPTDPHIVDGLSGATITSQGVQAMILAYMENYKGFFRRVGSHDLGLINK
jgi:Na+-transporting NADH:ubiquinone oxidoreductase subunit C